MHRHPIIDRPSTTTDDGDHMDNGFGQQADEAALLLFQSVSEFRSTWPEEERAGFEAAVTHVGLEASTNLTTVAGRWVVALHEPLISVANRSLIERDMARQIRINPRWSAYFFSGFLAAVVDSLPEADPWRNLDARVDLEILSGGAKHDVILKTGEGRIAPRRTGAFFADGRAFGQEQDGWDIVPSEITLDATTDIGLMGTVGGLTPLAAAILGLAGDRKLLCSALEDIYQALWISRLVGIAERRAADHYLEAIALATRWAIWRRRAYRVPNDFFVEYAGSAWVTLSQRLAEGEPESILEEQPLEGPLPDSEYLERVSPEDYLKSVDLGDFLRRVREEQNPRDPQDGSDDDPVA